MKSWQKNTPLPFRPCRANPIDLVTKPQTSPLPYTDTKPVGASDFYFAINATFRFVLGKLGIEGLRRYWTDLGSRYCAPVSARWQSGGLAAVSEYWRAFFAAEPDAEVEVKEDAGAVTLQVKTCPAIKHLRDNGREILPCFCQHCYFISEAMAAPAGLIVRVSGGDGTCRQVFQKREAVLTPQDLTQIKEATSC